MNSTMTRRRFCKDAVATSVVASIALSTKAGEKMKAKPFVKWAGGKRQLIEQLQSLFPSDLATRENLTYVEPFVGGGAMVFYMLAA